MSGQKLKWKLSQLLSVITALWLMAMPVNAQDMNMSDQRPELLYSINIDAKNMFMKLYINDAYILFHGGFD